MYSILKACAVHAPCQSCISSNRHHHRQCIVVISAFRLQHSNLVLDSACCCMGLQTTIRAISGAYQQIDHAISEALYQSKPVLIQVASNMASLTHPLFEEQPVPFSLTGKTTNEVSLRTRESGEITSIVTYSFVMLTRLNSAECVQCVCLYHFNLMHGNILVPDSCVPDL